jgi:hypothetical protein
VGYVSLGTGSIKERAPEDPGDNKKEGRLGTQPSESG